MIWPILSGTCLGWSLGSNDAANVFGTAVASRTIRYSTAVVLICIFVLLGAVLQGGPTIVNVGSVTKQSITSASIVCLMAALTVTLMTGLKLPVSTT